MGAILPPEVLPGEGGWGRELNILDLLHMRNTHSNFQLPTYKTDLTYYLSEMGVILLPRTLSLGELGGG